MLLILGIAPGRVLGADAAPPITDADVNADIAGMKAYFYSRQDPDSGGWEEADAKYPGAQTALVTLALLVSGESSQRPEIERALAFLRSPKVQSDKTKGPDGKVVYTTTIYKASLLAHIWAHLPEAYHSLLVARALGIEQACHDGTWHYTPDQLDFDHSTTQYGVLGLWEAAQRGVHLTNPALWQHVFEHFRKTQLPHGGWAYTIVPGQLGADAAATQSMTCAGLTALLVAQQETLRTQLNANPELAAMVQKGLAWLDHYFDPTTNPGEDLGQNKGAYPCYSLYCVERVALASGVKRLHAMDWYRAGAQFIDSRIDRKSGAAGNDVDTAFYLMFLSRGRVPVWITKLQVADHPATWNNRPNDIYFLTRFLSDARQGELNWQTLDLSAPAEDLRSAPVLYYSSGLALTLDAAQARNLKRYLDLGGLLWINPEAGSGGILTDSVRTLAKSLYPDLTFKPLPADHPLYRAEFDLKATDFPVQALSNGDRELILMPMRDLGADYQRLTPMDAAQSPPHQFALNLFTYACDRGHIQPRLEPRFDTRLPGAPKGTLEIARPRYGAETWLTEPAAWQPAATRAFNRAQIDVTVTPGDPAKAISLDALGACDDKLVWLTGVAPYTLTDTEKQAIALYVRRGGTILVENIGARSAMVAGSRGGFADAIATSLKPIFGAAAQPLVAACPDHPILTGEQVPGLYNISTVTYRRATAWLLQTVGFQPRLYTFLVRGRPAILLSHYDLSLGLLDVRRWGIEGYSPESSRQILSNIILWANTQKLVPASDAPALNEPRP